MDKSQAVKIINKFVKALKNTGISVDRVILFGSYAKGAVNAVKSSS